MGIYIPDMTIPQSDNEEIIIHSDGIAIKYRCGYGKLIKMMKTVVEIPDHGRCIDADELMEDSGEVCESYGDYCEFGFSREQIANAKTIIPASTRKR